MARTAEGRRPPVVALDVDGVVNVLVRDGVTPGEHVRPHRIVLRAEEWPAKVEADWQWPDAGRFLCPLDGPTQDVDLHIDDRIGPWVTALLTRGVEVVWASTWRHAANTFISPLLGIPDLPVIDGDCRMTETSDQWKDRWLRHYAGGRPLVWIDDRPVPVARWWPDSWYESGPGLVVIPEPQIGLTPAHREQVDAWLAPWLDGSES